MNQRLVPALLLVISASFVSGRAQKDENVALEREEYAVYSSLIRDLYFKDARRQVVIAIPTCCGAEATAKYGSHFLYQQWAPISWQRRMPSGK